MSLSALAAAAYVEVQRATGRKPSLTSKLNRLLRRPVEPDFAALERLDIPAGRIIIDAGANRGETIAATRLFQPSVPIVAFEPNPLLHELILARNDRDPALSLQPFGLGETPGSFDLHVPYYKGVPFDGLASFDRTEAATFLNSERLTGFDPQHLTVRTVHCQIQTLDSFDLPPAFLKIDVQGFEAALIRGGLKTISTFKPVVLMENNRPEIDAAALLNLGYRAHAWDGANLIVDQIGTLNTFYIHQANSMFSEACFTRRAH